MRRGLATLGVAGAVLGAVAVPGAAAAAPPGSGVTVVAKGLDGPWGVSFGPRGLYVVESDAAKITTVDLASGRQRTYQSDLPADGIDVAADGTVWTVTGESETPSPKSTRLFRIKRPGQAAQVANLLNYELKHNPDGQSQQARDSLSNPFAVLHLPGRTLVADAGGNSVLSVTPGGTVSTFFAPRNITKGACAGAENNDPQHPGCDPVPTGLALGPDGYVYVSGLGAEAPGAARVWKLDARTGAVVKTYGGFTALTGIAVGPDRSIYVSELLYGAPQGDPPPGFDPSTVGRITRIAPDGTRTHVHVTMPLGLSVHHGQLYSSAWSVASFVGLPAGTGQVVRVSPAAFK